MSTSERAGGPSIGRFVLSEFAMVLRRRRNQVILLVLFAVPIAIGIAVKVHSRRHPASGLIGNITDNGIFVAFTALVVTIPVLFPLAVSVLAGDSVSGEASSGTLRYLLTVPVGRTRLLAVKFAALALWSVLIGVVVAVGGVVIGLIVFPSSEVVLLSGTPTSLTGGLGRLAIVVGYAALMMLALSSLGLFISTLTEVPLAAMAATLVVAIVMQVLDTVPQLAAIHPELLSHYLLDFGDVLRNPLLLGGLRNGALVAVAYIVIFCSLAWARFTSRDVTS